MKLCEGRFSPETVTLLREAFARFEWSAPETFHSYSCSICGRAGLQAKITRAFGSRSHTTAAAKAREPIG